MPGAIDRSGMTVREIARTSVVTVGPGQTAGNVATLLREEDVGSAVVVEEDRPVGIVTDRDLAMKVLEPRADPRETTAADVMSADPTTAGIDDGIFEVTRAMLAAEVRRLPLVDAEGSLAGIVTHDDLLVLLADELAGLAGVVEAESPPY